MSAHDGSTPDAPAFTPDELALLGLFHAGVRAHVLRARYGLDPWPVVNRHRQLPREEFARIRELADRAAAAAGRADCQYAPQDATHNNNSVGRMRLPMASRPAPSPVQPMW